MPENVTNVWSKRMSSKIERGFDYVEGKHVPTVKVRLDPCGPDDSAAWEARDLLAGKIEQIFAAPVVERQPVAWMYLERSEDGYEYRPLFSHQKWLVLPDGFYEESPLYTDPPELAELQATIARLTAENERLKSESFESLYNDAIDEIERLKGGQGEAE
jgi:hypothetical protein